MPTTQDIEAQIEELAKASSLPQGDVTSALQGMTGLIETPSGGDPVNAAYDKLQTSAATVLRDSLAGGGGVAGLFRRGAKIAKLTSDPALAITREQKAYQDNPVNRYGGPELVGAFQNQGNQDTTRDLPIGEFQNRVRLASVLSPDTLDQLKSFRASLDEGQRYSFDEAYFRDLNNGLQGALKVSLNKAAGGDGSFIEAGPQAVYFTDKKGRMIQSRPGETPQGDNVVAHYYNDPEQEKLMKKWADVSGIPFSGTADVLSGANELKYRIQNDPAQFKDFLNLPGNEKSLDYYNQITGQGTAGALKQDFWSVGTQALAAWAGPKAGDAIGAPVLAALKVTDFAGLTPDVEGQARAIIEQNAQGLIEGALTPVGLASILIPVVGDVKGLTMVQRMVARGLEGGFFAVTTDEKAAQQHDTQAMAMDFVAGAFGAATLPEVVGAIGSLVKRGVRKIGTSEVRATLAEANGNTAVVNDANGTVKVPGAEDVPNTQTPALAEGITATEAVDRTLETTIGARQELMLAQQDASVARREARNLAQRAKDANNNVPIENVNAAQERAARARQRVIDAQKRIADLQARADTEDYARRMEGWIGRNAPAMNAAQDARDLIVHQYKMLAEEGARTGDAAMSPNGFRRQMSIISGVITGRLPGFMSHIAQSGIALRNALDQLAIPVLDRLSKGVDDLVKQHLDDALYVDSRDRAAFLKDDFAKIRDIARHPEMWNNVHPQLRRAITQFQLHADAKFKLLDEMGYDTAAARENYLTQLWENDPGDIKAALTGKKAFAKDAVFGDYVQGVQAGLTPRNLTLEQIFRLYDKALNEALSDAYIRKLMVDRYGVKGKKLGMAQARSPLYNGYSFPRHIAEAIDALNTTNGTMLRNARTLSQRFKNTMLGAFDMGVWGVQMTHAGVWGNLPYLSSLVNDGLRMAHLPHVMIESLQNANLGKRVLAAADGTVQGHIAANFEPEMGTIIGLVPGLRRVDELLTKHWTENLAHLQFDTILTPTRNRIYEGGLIISHLLGKNIEDANVRRASARLANAATLTSEGAQRGTRRGFENAAATSANAIRGELGTINQLANIFLRKQLSDPERIAGAMALASFAVSVYGVSSLATMVQGGEPMPFNPFDKKDGYKWGTIQIGNKHIQLIKEKDIVRAVAKSVKALQEHDPAKVAEVWTQLTIGKTSPLFSSAIGLSGYGYDTQGFFHAGDLPATQRLLNLAPTAPIFDRMIYNKDARTNPATISLEAFGFNNFDASASERRDNWVKEHNPYPQGDPRWGVVANNGYNGLEDAEKAAVRQEHPEFFQSVSPSFKKDAEALTQHQNDLLELEQKVQADPYLRTDYRSMRQKVELNLSDAVKNSKVEPVTVQGQAKKIYFDTLDEFKQNAPGNVLTGDDYGNAVEEGRKRVADKLGKDGTDALDRSLSYGVTGLETEYKTDALKIQESGYFKLRDAAIQQLKAEGKLPFDTYQQFMKEINQYARETGTTPESLDAFKAVQGVITKGTNAWRETHPEIDALLVKWGYTTVPRSEAAQTQAADALGRKNLPLAADVAKRIKEAKQGGGALDINSLIARYTK